MVFTGQLTFAKLEPSPGAPVPILLPFHHPRVPGKETVVSEGYHISLIHLAERPGKTMTAGSGLTVGAAAVDIDQHIKLVFAGGNHQRLADHYCVLALGKILSKFLAVYHD